MLLYTCRTCASITETEKLRNLSKELSLENETINIFKALSSCFTLNLSQSKQFPQQICEECLKKLEESYRFWKKCQRSEILFKSIFKEDCENSYEVPPSSTKVLRKSPLPLRTTSTIEKSLTIEPIESNQKKHIEEHSEDAQIVGADLINSNKSTITATDYVLSEESENNWEAFFLEDENNSVDVDAERNVESEAKKCFKIEELPAQLEEDLYSIEMKLDLDDAPIIKSGIDIDDGTIIKREHFTCDRCFFLTDVKDQLDLHVLKHLLEDDVAEVESHNLVTTTTNSIEEHPQNEKKKYFKCVVCSMKFPKKRLYKQHLTKHSKEELNVYSCSICHKNFKSNTILGAHMVVHKPDRPFSCDICDKTFKVKSNLTTHMTLHFGKPHLCSNCGKRFSTAGDLVNHYRRHTGEKPYKCDKCPAKYMQKSHLSTHMETHVIGKPQQCKICNKKYKTKECLRIHMFKHNGYPFYCPECERPFIKKYLLKRHLEAKHNTNIDVVNVEKNQNFNVEEIEEFEAGADAFSIEYLEESLDST